MTLYRYKRTNKGYTEDLGNGVAPTLMLIPAGEFVGERVWQQALEANLIIDYDLWERAQVELKENILVLQIGGDEA